MDAGGDNGLVAAKAGAFVHGARVASLELEAAFGSCHEEGTCLVHCVESSEVDTHASHKRLSMGHSHGHMSFYMLQKSIIVAFCALKSNMRLTAWGARDCVIICRFFTKRTLQKNNMSLKCRTIVTGGTWKNKNL